MAYKMQIVIQNVHLLIIQNDVVSAEQKHWKAFC